MAQTTRSPRHPAIDLKEAIKRIRQVYDKEQRHPADKAVIADDLGYGGINGASNRTIAALLHYGLLENIGERLRVSDDAFNILIHEHGEAERVRAVEEAAYKPSLFAKLRSEFGDALPSNSNLRAFLLKEGFNQNTVDNVIKLYRVTISFVREEQAVTPDSELGDEAEPKIAPSREVPMYTQVREATPRQTQPRPDSIDPLKTINLPASLADDGWHDPLWFRISRDCEVRVAFKGRVTQKAMSKFIDFLRVSVDVYPDDEPPKEVLKEALEPAAIPLYRQDEGS